MDSTPGPGGGQVLYGKLISEAGTVVDHSLSDPQLWIYCLVVYVLMFVNLNNSKAGVTYMHLMHWTTYDPNQGH